VPGPYDRPTGCLFNPRCAHARDDCRRRQPTLDVDAGGKGYGRVRCFHPVAQREDAA
jgi:dipeptide transport system ATP-binding protein